MRTKVKSALILNCIVGISSLSPAQTGRVGINTATPKSTLDINGQKDSSGTLLVSDITGIQAPRLSRQDLSAKGNQLYGSDQKGTIVYITDITGGDNLSQRTNITSIGYYYFDGTLWQKFIDNQTYISPSGFERKPDLSAGNFYWKLIGAPAGNYGAPGKYGLDASWNPENLNEIFTGSSSYNNLLASSGLTVANLGALGKNSFTAGTINSASGDASTSLGAGNISSGLGAFAAGISSSATNSGAVAMGFVNRATGNNSVAIGSSNIADASSVALGTGNSASAVSTVAIGLNNNLSGSRSYVMGEANTSTAGSARTGALGTANTLSAVNSVAVGDQNVTSGNFSLALGNNLSPESMFAVMTGYNNTAETSPQPNALTNSSKRLFLVGNGFGSKSDAFTILRNGKTGIDIDNFETTASDAKLQVNGTVKIAVLSATSACNSANEGTIQYVKTAGTGVFQGCIQTSATPTYGWVNLN